jgi:hypothetical protein
VTLFLLSNCAVIDDKEDEHEIGTCELESKRPIVTIKDTLRAFKVIIHYYEACGSDENLYIIWFCIENDL